jgi:hypothetical protein
MNILLLVVIQNMYKTMKTSITEIINLYDVQTIKRNEEVNKIFEIMKQILGETELQIQETDLNKLNELINKVKSESVTDKEQLIKLANGKLIDQMNLIQSIGQTGTVTPPGQTPSPPRGGNKKTMKAGFVRGSSTFPAQEFFNL